MRVLIALVQISSTICYFMAVCREAFCSQAKGQPIPTLGGTTDVGGRSC